MDQDVLRQAIKTLQDDLEKLLAEVNKKKSAINVLYETLGERAPYAIEGELKSQQIGRSQFYGKGFVPAAREFLQLKADACTAEEICQGLEQGAFDFTWKPNDRVRMVAISLAKNSSVFHKLPNNTFGLLTWYPDLARKKANTQNKEVKTEDNGKQEQDDLGGSRMEGESNEEK